MRTDEIIARATALGLPIAENEFRKTKETPLPDPPYLIWFEDGKHGTGADNAVLFVEKKIVLELYTDKIADEAIEQKIEQQVLYDTEYRKYQALIQNEDLVQTAYEFTVLEKLPKGARKYG